MSSSVSLLSSSLLLLSSLSLGRVGTALSMEWLSAATTSRFSRKFLLGKSVVNIFLTFVYFCGIVCNEDVQDSNRGKNEDRDEDALA